MISTHSKLGASSMYRWSKCPGSVRLSAPLPEVESKYAEEGSDAHAYAAYCVSRPARAVDPYDVGREFLLDGRAVTPDEGMLAAVEVYCAEVRRNIGPLTQMHIEQRFDLSVVHPGCFGTADCVIWQPLEECLVVLDYKHGAGVPVAVENNPQLKYYGLGALLALNYPAKTVRLGIVQPRCAHPDGSTRYWDVPVLDMLDFRADLIEYAKATEAPDAPLNTGDWCRFCPARAVCPALMSQATALAKIEFSPALSYDPAALKRALDARSAIKAWLQGLDEFAYAEAEAGRCPSGYKLVEKRAVRKWRDPVKAGEILSELGLSDDVLFKPLTVKSPAQLDKEMSKKTLESLVVRESSGHTLVPESDRRPSVKPAAKDEFTSLPKGTDTDD